MQVRIKRLNNDAVVPKYAKDGDAGMDLTATSISFDDDGNVIYGTGLAFEIPRGYVGLLFPRSSNAKKDLILSNSVGVIDSGYRGEVMFKFKPSMVFYEGRPTHAMSKNVIYEIGDRIGQLIIMPYPSIEFTECNELSETERGAGGYGSTGNK